jgi:NitT/TauT family transport system permease protein
MATATQALDVPSVGRRRRARGRHRLKVLAIQLAIVAVFLAAWEWLPQIGSLSDSITLLDPYFISSPSAIWDQLVALATGDDIPSMWPYVWSTVEASLIGIVAGSVLGALAGLVLANSPGLSEIFRPFLIALNAVPRIALIPVIVIIAGPTLTASIVTAILVVFFVVFFNAYEGGRTVPPQVIQNVQMLGGSRSQVMWRVRLRYVEAWTFAALPNAVSFGLVAVVTSEILTGTVGLGRLLLDSVTTVQSSLTFAVVAVLSVLGFVLVAGAEIASRRLMHWWYAEGGVGN